MGRVSDHSILVPRRYLNSTTSTFIGSPLIPPRVSSYHPSIIKVQSSCRNTIGRYGVQAPKGNPKRKKEKKKKNISFQVGHAASEPWFERPPKRLPVEHIQGLKVWTKAPEKWDLFFPFSLGWEGGECQTTLMKWQWMRSCVKSTRCVLLSTQISPNLNSDHKQEKETPTRWIQPPGSPYIVHPVQPEATSLQPVGPVQANDQIAYIDLSNLSINHRPPSEHLILGKIHSILCLLF